MNDFVISGDESILKEIGIRLCRYRLDLQMTQAQLANQAGVSKRTVERLEAGASTQLSTFIRVLRVLQLLPRLEQLVPEAGPRPIDLLKLRGKERRRASGKRVKNGGEQWAWRDDT